MDYRKRFMDFVGRPGDPYDCWQEDGFWPDRVVANMEDLLVWGAETGLSYLNNGGMVGYLQYISGRTLPELELGFQVLKCRKSARACKKVRERFGKLFPRSDTTRSDMVAADEAFFEKCGSDLWQAMESDGYETSAEAYFRAVCIANSIVPRIFPGS